jgi:TRAP transporter TAXI family solute receptor
MGILTSADAIAAYTGSMIYKRPHRNARILVVGGLLQLSFYVSKDSPMEAVADLRGKRIPTDFPGIPIVKLSSSAVLAASGLTYGDIVKVPVSDLAANAQAFLEGRTDAAWYSVGAPAVEEANARKGVKFISAASTPEATKKMAEIYPGSYPSVVKAGSATGVVKDTVFLTNDIYLIAAREMSDETAYEVVKTLWERNEELAGAYPALKQWRRERMVSEKATIPYHPGVVRFFKEKGVWGKEMDGLQAKLMAQ